jgi:putative DNA primase/helicase
MTAAPEPTYEEFYAHAHDEKARDTLNKKRAELLADMERDPGYPLRGERPKHFAELRDKDPATWLWYRGIFDQAGFPVRILDRALDQIDAGKAGDGQAGPATPITAIPSTDLLNMKIPPREIYLSPWIAAQSISMVFANRGTGKTFFLMSTALALASGSSFLGWTTTAPRKVAYIEGELPLASLQDRCRMLGSHPNLTIVNPELQPDLYLPHLSTEAAQQLFDPIVTAHDVLILDSLATLAPCSFDKDSENWAHLQPWFLSIRRRGKALTFAHHTNRAGTQRGISAREDVLDFVLKLEKASEDDRRCHFTVSYEKTRQFDPTADANKLFATFDAELCNGEWRTTAHDTSQLLAVADLTLEGKPIRKIADITGLPKTTVNRLQKQARAKGIL